MRRRYAPGNLWKPTVSAKWFLPVRPPPEKMHRKANILIWKASVSIKSGMRQVCVEPKNKAWLARDQPW